MRDIQYTQTDWTQENPDERGRLIDNIVNDMKTVPEHIQLRQIGHFTKADAEYGRRVADGLGLKIDEAALSVK